MLTSTLHRFLLPAILGVSLAVSGVVVPDTVRAANYGPGANISIANYGFHPQVLRVVVGTTVTWWNYDGYAHTSTSDTGVWDSGPIAPRASFHYTFTTPGTYWYHCKIHPFMHGAIVVVPRGQVAATVNPVPNGGTTVIVGQGFTPNTLVFVQWRRPDMSMPGFWTFTNRDGAFAFGLFADPRHGCGPRTFMVFDSATGVWSSPFVLNEIC